MIEHPTPRISQRHADGSPFGGLIFATGTFFGMGLMLFLLQLWGPGDEPDIEHYRDVRDLVMDSYVGETTEEELLESALRGMLNNLDQHSRYYVEEETDAVNRDTSGQTVGIGVIMRYADAPTIVFPVEGSPAESAGLRVGDEILQVGEQSVAGLDQDAVSDLIQGEQGTAVLLTVKGRDGQTRTHELKRARMLVPSVRRVSMLDEASKIGYLALVSFTNESVREFDAAVESLQRDGLDALVVDLRENRGGVLSAAVELARRFVPDGTITSTEGRGKPHYEYSDDEHARYAGLPLVLLVDGLSASASEVLAGALQDHRAAVLLGTPTYGKGVVQTVNRFPARHAIAKLTTSYYYTPAHRGVQRSSDDSHPFGLRPDFLVDVPEEEHDAVIAYLHSWEPPAAAREELRAWSAAEDVSFQLDSPPDSQLALALDLFHGRIPGTPVHD